MTGGWQKSNPQVLPRVRSTQYSATRVVHFVHGTSHNPRFSLTEEIETHWYSTNQFYAPRLDIMIVTIAFPRLGPFTSRTPYYVHTQFLSPLTGCLYQKDCIERCQSSVPSIGVVQEILKRYPLNSRQPNSTITWSMVLSCTCCISQLPFCGSVGRGNIPKLTFLAFNSPCCD